jgi:hypothetical protein
MINASEGDKPVRIVRKADPDFNYGNIPQHKTS